MRRIALLITLLTLPGCHAGRVDLEAKTILWSVALHWERAAEPGTNKERTSDHDGAREGNDFLLR